MIQLSWGQLGAIFEPSWSYLGAILVISWRHLRGYLGAIGLPVSFRERASVSNTYAKKNKMQLHLDSWQTDLPFWGLVGGLVGLGGLWLGSAGLQTYSIPSYSIPFCILLCPFPFCVLAKAPTWSAARQAVMKHLACDLVATWMGKSSWIPPKK